MTNQKNKISIPKSQCQIKSQIQMTKNNLRFGYWNFIRNLKLGFGICWFNGFLFMVLVFGFWFLVYPVMAVNVDLNLTPPGIEKGETPEFSAYLQWLLRFLLGAAGILAVLMIIVGGAQYVLAGASGKPEDIKDAQTRIKMAIGGLVLALSSWLILSIINPDLLKLKLPGLSSSDFKEPSTGTAFEWVCLDINGERVASGIVAEKIDDCNIRCKTFPNGHHCDPISTEFVNKPKADGEPCMTKSDCLSGFCDRRDTLSNESGLCRRTLPFGEISEGGGEKCKEGDKITTLQDCLKKIDGCDASQEITKICMQEEWQAGAPGECQKKDPQCEVKTEEKKDYNCLVKWTAIDEFESFGEFVYGGLGAFTNTAKSECEKLCAEKAKTDAAVQLLNKNRNNQKPIFSCE